MTTRQNSVTMAKTSNVFGPEFRCTNEEEDRRIRVISYCGAMSVDKGLRSELCELLFVEMVFVTVGLGFKSI